MKIKGIRIFSMLLILTAVAAGIFIACSPQKVEVVRPVKIADNVIEPKEWGKAYPVHYDMWRSTEDPTPAGKSKYKRGWDTDKIVYDKLSEYPFMALLFNGWGFGVEYNEPRGHYYMIKDQLDIDRSRIGAGGVCLSCKTPYAPKLEKEMGVNYYKTPYLDVHANNLPKEHQELGVACIDCHDNKDMSLKISRGFTLVKALQAMGVDESKLTHQQKRSLVCAQCHVTYNIPKDADKKSVGLYFPWQGSTMGNITVENIIKQIRADETAGEWKQAVTGYKMPFMRHAEFELFTNNSVHWKAGAACADCHMPYTKVGSAKVSDHRVMSPLKNEMKACQQCHTETQEWLVDQVTNIQDRTNTLLIRAGYATATAAKLIEKVHALQAEGKAVDTTLYDKAKDFYMEAFFRTLFIGGENSVGFHNPSEANRILGDSIAFAGKSEALLRQALAKAGYEVPMVVDLELGKYTNKRGKKELNFDPSVEIPDTFNIQSKFEAAKTASAKPAAAAKKK